MPCTVALALLTNACSGDGQAFSGTEAVGAGPIAVANAAQALSRISPKPAPGALVPTLSAWSSVSLGGFNESAAEIVDFHPQTKRVFVVNAHAGVVNVLQLTSAGLKDTGKVLAPSADIPGFVGGNANSVAVNCDMVAIAVEASLIDAPGRVALYNARTLKIMGWATVGALPDMLVFTPDGRKILVANEGEQVRDAASKIVRDAEGSVSIIDVSRGPWNPAVTQLTFDAWNGRKEALRLKGVRIPALAGSSFASGAGSVSVAQDLEPEYIAVSPDSRTAFVTLQENNAFAVVDIASATIRDIVPLGLKEYSRGLPTLESFSLLPGDMPELGVTPAGQALRLGGFSGLWFVGAESTATRKVFYTIPDRGPNPDPVNFSGDAFNVSVRPHAVPGYTARIIKIALENGTLSIEQEIPLTRADGSTPISGRANHSALDASEIPVDTLGNALQFDAFGGDFEGLAVDAEDDSFWLVDEYRPAIYNFSKTGVLLTRLIPEGVAATADEPVGSFGTENLPAVYNRRRANRGFEAVAIDPGRKRLYAFIQSPLANPSAVAASSNTLRILAVDIDKSSASFGLPVAEYVYLLEGGRYFDTLVDKIGDATFIGDDQFYVIERDSSSSASAQKFVFKIDLKGATNTLSRITSKTLEASTADELVELEGIRPVAKTKVFNLPSIGYIAGDKAEGITVLDDGRVAVINDNDFGIQPGPISGDGSVLLQDPPTPTVLGLISFTRPNGLDASDRDSAINIQNWPVFGMYMPDALAAFSRGGEPFYISANEGDTRDYDEARGSGLVLDSGVFPNASSLRSSANLGRLKVSPLDGDLDGDGDKDQIHAFGARSFSIWDRYGNLAFDSGSALETLTAALLPEYFNSNHEEANSFDSRSDDKGPEPEGIAVGTIGTQTFAFLALEGMGGIVVIDVSEPYKPTIVSYFNPRDFSGDPALGSAGDLGPEGLKFVPATASPTGKPLLLVANEVSGTVAAYKIAY